MVIILTLVMYFSGQYFILGVPAIRAYMWFVGEIWLLFSR